MNAQWPSWLGDLFQVFPTPVASLIVTLVSVACGAAVGIDRGKREKPAGLRSMMLICLGAAIFTQAGLLMAGPSADSTRIAAQVATGVGFLGAGAIIHSRGKILGFTTAAAIWVVAAIGMVVGAGYVTAGVVFTLLVTATLTLEDRLDSFVDGPCRWRTARVVFKSQGGRGRWLIQEILDQGSVDHDSVHFERDDEERSIVTFRYCDRHKQHRAVMSAIASLTVVQTIESSDVEAGVQFRRPD